MIKALIFDCFGVLVGRGFDETYRLAGGDPSKDADFITDVLGEANMGVITPQQMRDRITRKLKIESSVWEAAVRQAEQLNTELLEYISTLKGTYKLAILSNANVGTLKRIFTAEQLGIFDSVVVSAEVHMVKPQPEIYEYTADSLNVLPDECVFIDDIKEYVRGASAKGMKTLLYKDFSLLKQELEPILSSL